MLFSLWSGTANSSKIPAALRRTPTPRNPVSTRYAKSWPRWVEENCTALAERREVPCISLEKVLADWLRGRPIARTKIDAQGSDLDIVKSAGAHMDKLLYVIMEAQGTMEAPLYEGQAPCDELQTQMRSLGFILADTGRLPACNKTGGLPYPFHEEDIAFVRHELRHLWRAFYDEHPYCRHGIVSAAGACGGPYCMAPAISAHVNRSGGCNGLIEDTLTFGPSAIGLLVLATTHDCTSQAQVDVDRGNLTVQVLQGHARGRRRCAAKFVAIQSLHGPLIRVRSGVGTASDFHVRALLLPGLLDLSPAQFREAFQEFHGAISSSIGAASSLQLVWPRSCSDLPVHVQSNMPASYATLEQPGSRTCAMDRRKGWHQIVDSSNPGCGDSLPHGISWKALKFSTET